MLELWEELDMSTVAGESGLSRELLLLLERESIRYEILDGAIVVNAPPTFSHERLIIRLAVQLDSASPPGIDVLGSGFKYFYAAVSEGNVVNHTMADLTVVRTADVEEQGTVNPPLLVVEVQSPGTQRRGLGEKRELYERGGVSSYLLLSPELRTLTVLELVDGRYVETQRAEPPAVVHLERPFRVDLDLSRVFRA